MRLQQQANWERLITDHERELEAVSGEQGDILFSRVTLIDQMNKIFPSFLPP